MSRTTYVTTAIAYVNGDPHLGHALEFVQTDVLARHRRLRGDDVRHLSGTDDNALKNVQAADAAGLPVADFVSARADRFAALRGPLELSHDDFIRTSTDPRHRPGVERLWRACDAAGDLEPRDYTGLYCTGCEAFLDEDGLVDGLCLEHERPPEAARERNWFFRLSRHGQRLGRLISSGELDVTPAHRRNEVLALIAGGLTDFSVSRPAERARGWGVPVPGDPGQVVYVWFDALANYITALGFGDGDAGYEHWWRGSDERIHMVGKGITRFHAVYWPAILLSAGEPLPTRILVHDYLTADGRKLSKSLGNAVGPEELVDRYGADALRWWLVRDVPRSGDADFRDPQLARRANELADGLGNLVARTLALAARSTVEPRTPAGSPTTAWPPPSRACRPRSTPRSRGTTCGRRRRPSGRWSRRRTGTSPRHAHGSWTGRRETRSSRTSWRRAPWSPASSSRSFPAAPPGSRPRSHSAIRRSRAGCSRSRPGPATI